MDELKPKADVCYLCGAVVVLDEVMIMRETTARECLILNRMKYTSACEGILALSDIQNICTLCFVKMYKKIILGYESIFVDINTNQSFLSAEKQLKAEEEITKDVSVIGSQIPISSVIKEQPAMYETFELDEQERIVLSKLTFDELTEQNKNVDAISESKGLGTINLRSDHLNYTTRNNTKGYNNIKKLRFENNFENTETPEFGDTIFTVASWFVCAALVLILVVLTYTFPYTVLITLFVFSGLLIILTSGVILYVKVKTGGSILESTQRLIAVCDGISHLILQGLKISITQFVKEYNFKQHITNMLNVAWGCKL